MLRRTRNRARSRHAVSLPQPARRFDATPGSLAGLRIGVSADFGHAPVAPDIRAAFAAAVDALADAGAEMRPVEVGFGDEILETVFQPIGYTEQATAAMDRDPVALARSDPEFQAVVGKGKGYRGTDYMAATHRRAQLRGRFLALFSTVDALVTPTVAVTAFSAGTLGVDTVDGVAVDRHLGWSPFSWPINLSGLPAASLPCGFDGDGLPIGLQVVAPWLGEPTIIRVAAAFEAARPWAYRRPSFREG